MTDERGELSIDPKAAAAIQRWLLPEERILWAASRSSISARDWFEIVPASLAICVAMAFGLWAGWRAMLFMIVPGGWLLVGSIQLARLWFWRFAVTTHGVIIANTFWPRGAMGWSSRALDKHWIAHNRGKGIIKLGGVADRGGGFLISMRSHRSFIDNVPDIEAVRDLILRRLAASETRQSMSAPAHLKRE